VSRHLLENSQDQQPHHQQEVAGIFAVQAEGLLSKGLVRVGGGNGGIALLVVMIVMRLMTGTILRVRGSRGAY